MSKKRKSFILHYDSLNVLDDLTNEQAGLLFKAIKAYHLNEDINLDSLTNIAMSPFKNQFERDANKYEKLCEKNRLIAESRYRNKSTTGKSGNQTLPNTTKSTDNDSKSDSKSDSKNIKEVIEHLNIVTNAKYKHTTKSHSENISARLNEGHSIDDLKRVIDSKASEWLTDKTMAQYLRPSTLFSASKFNGYLINARPKQLTQEPRAFSQ